MELINHYSMLWSGLFVIGLVAFFLLRDGFKQSDGFILAGIVIVMSAIWLVLRPARGTEAAAPDVLAEVGQGQPVLLELQSPF